MQKQKMGKTLRDDISQGGFYKNLKREFKELEGFYLDDERLEQMKNLGWFRRTFKSLVGLFKSLFFHLTPMRRLLLVLAIALFFSISAQVNGGDVQLQRNGGILSLLIFLFILMLELKDKLLAKNELQAGRAVQQALMPEEQPDVKGWQIFLFNRPANDVGGDLVDYFKIGAGQFDIVLGDVAGKGLPAALFMAKLQSTLRAIAADYSDLPKLIGKVNEIFCRDGLPSRFASLVYLRLVENKPDVRMVNAGHYPPVLIQGNRIQELAKGAPAVGLSAKTSYNETSLTLKQDDILFIFSDGLTEARNDDGLFYGDDRLNELLKGMQNGSVSQIAGKIIRSVDHFVGDAPAADDLSFIILKRTHE